MYNALIQPAGEVKASDRIMRFPRTLMSIPPVSTEAYSREGGVGPWERGPTWWSGVAVAHCSRSKKLTYVWPG